MLYTYLTTALCCTWQYSVQQLFHTAGTWPQCYY